MKYQRLLNLVYSFGCINLILIANAHAQVGDQSELWTEWTSCNAECGTGVSSRTRPCNSNSNQGCLNEEKQYKVCNTHKCQNGEQNLKEKQCASHNGDKIGLRSYTWQPYSIDDSSCMLTCSAVGFGFYKTFSTVTNGTICHREGTSVCIEGKCKNFGCDNVVDSIAKADSCGVCGGDGTTCQIIDDMFAERKLEYGYNKVGTIPAGARNINITQLGRSRNYLALKEAEGDYFLNGNRRLSRDGKIAGAGARFHYHRRHHRRCPGECVLSKGPTSTDMDIMVLAFSHNPGIFYRYSLPSGSKSEDGDSSGSDGDAESLSQYEAIIVEDDFKGPKPGEGSSSNDTSSESSSSEGSSGSEDKGNSGDEKEDGVVQTAYNVTVDSDGRAKVSKVTQQNNGRGRRPLPPSPSGSKQMPGYTQSFRFIDRMLSKKKQATMKEGVNPKLSDKDRSYTVQADKVRQNGNTYGSSQNLIPNVPGGRGYKWEITGYTPCSKPCGTGNKTPFVECYFNRRRVSDSFCRNIIKPSLDPISCNMQPCRGMWKTSDWSPCSVTCGQGTQTRTLTCVYQMSSAMYAEADERDCNGIPKPNTSQVCTIKTCNQWQADDWGSCSVSCGSGRKTRQIMCKSEDGRRVRNEDCDSMDMPTSESVCDMGSCQKTTSFFVSMRAWYYTEWPDTCPVECGSGKQVRKVVCLGDDINTDPSKSCTEASRPESERECKSRKRCQPDWFTGAWSKCNTTCGNGYQLRDVVCVRKSGAYGFDIVPDYLCPREKPESEERCDLPDCPGEWYMSDWGKCSVTCGTGRKTRDIMCIDGTGRKSTACSQNTKPTAVEECRNLPCRFETRNSLPIDRAVSDKYRPNSRYSSRSSTRSRTRSRSRSRSRQRPRASSVRQQRRRTATSRSQTQASTGACRDQYSRCDTIVKRNLCGHSYYRRLCCISCKT